MTKYEIIEQWAKNKIIEKVVSKYSKSEQADDLSQIIYLYLLEKDEETIIKIYNEDIAEKYITGMVFRQIMSYSSRYYMDNRRLLKEGVNIDENIEYWDGELCDEEPDNDLYDRVITAIEKIKLTPMEKDILNRLLQEYHSDEYLNDLSEVYDLPKRSITNIYYKILNSIYYSINGCNRLKRYETNKNRKLVVYKNNIKICEYSGPKECSEKTGIKLSAVKNVLQGKIKATKYNGEKYWFKYEEI